MSALVKLWIAVAVLMGLIVCVFKINGWTLKGTFKSVLKGFPVFVLIALIVLSGLALPFHYVLFDGLVIPKKRWSFNRTIVTRKTLEELRDNDYVLESIFGNKNDAYLQVKLIQDGLLPRPRTIQNELEDFQKEMEVQEKEHKKAMEDIEKEAEAWEKEWKAREKEYQKAMEDIEKEYQRN